MKSKPPQSKQRWREGREPLWFVIGNNGSIWLSTASFWKRRSIAQWEFESKKPWRYWYRNGFRCRQAKIRYALTKGQRELPKRVKKQRPRSYDD